MASVAVDRAGRISLVAAAQRIVGLRIALISAVFAIWAIRFIQRTSFIAIDGHRYYNLFDDAMISMRYAWNFAHGQGLVWNPGQHVQGYTNLLMTLYMSLGALVLNKVAAVVLIQVSGLFFLFACASLTMGIASSLCEDHTPRLRTTCLVLAFAAPLAYYPLDFWSLMGMETGLLAVLLLGATLGALRGARPGVVGTLLGLAFMTRPDALIPAAIILGYVWLTNPTVRRARLLLDSLVLIAFVLGVTGFQLWYYHAPVPNTYTLKATGMPLGLRLHNGWGFVRIYLADTWPFYAVAILGVLRRPQPERLLLLALPLSALLYQVYIGGDPWPYWRMMSPTMPLLLVLVLDTVARVPLREPTRIVATALLAATLLAISDVRFAPEITFQQTAYHVKEDGGDANIGLALAAISKPGASIAVISAGAIAYYSGLRAIDILGKSDVYIAHLAPDLSGSIAWSGMTSVPGHNKYDLRYSILRLRPTYTQVLRFGHQDIRRQASMYRWYDYHGVWMILDRTSRLVRWRMLTPVSRQLTQASAG